MSHRLPNTLPIVRRERILNLAALRRDDSDAVLVSDTDGAEPTSDLVKIEQTAAEPEALS